MPLLPNTPSWRGAQLNHRVWVRRIRTQFLVGKLEGKRPLGRPRLRWEYNIRMGVRVIG
jgi:hypothetical protein